MTAIANCDCYCQHQTFMSDGDPKQNVTSLCYSFCNDNKKLSIDLNKLL